MASIFPFNHLDDDDFELALYELAHGSLNYDFDRLATLHFNPLFRNSSSDLFQDLDPDTNFYRSTGCNYYLADQFTESFGSDIATNKSLFSVMHLNIRSLPRNLEKLSDYLLGILAKFSLIGLSETWLSADSGFVNIPGYNFVNQDRKGKSGGGVAFYLDEKLELKIRADLNYNDPDVLEALFIEVFNPHGKMLSQVFCIELLIITLRPFLPNTMTLSLAFPKKTRRVI